MQLIPRNLIQRAVALSIADVIAKEDANKKVPFNGYARYFLKHYLSNANPSKNELTFARTHGSKAEILEQINLLILSGGHYGSFLDPNFIAQAFPSISEAKEVRFETRVDANCIRTMRIDTKVEASKQSKAAEKIESLLKLGYENLPSWVEVSHDDGLDEFSIMNGLKEWYSKIGQGSEFEFGMIFHGKDSMQIAVELSYGDFSI